MVDCMLSFNKKLTSMPLLGIEHYEQIITICLALTRCDIICRSLYLVFHKADLLLFKYWATIIQPIIANVDWVCVSKTLTDIFRKTHA